MLIDLKALHCFAASHVSKCLRLFRWLLRPQLTFKIIVFGSWGRGVLQEHGRTTPETDMEITQPTDVNAWALWGPGSMQNRPELKVGHWSWSVLRSCRSLESLHFFQGCAGCASCACSFHIISHQIHLIHDSFWFILIHSDSSQLPPHLVAELQTLGFHRGSGWSRWGWHEGEIFSGKSLSFFTHVEKERQKKDIADKFTHIPWTFVTFVDIRQFYTLHRMKFVHLWSHSACAAQRICTQPFRENGGSVLSAQSVVETHLCQTSCDVTYNTMTLKASQIKSMNESIYEYAYAMVDNIWCI